ncbi:uncharacterized protein [Struthio camelus]|uniref:uncharacterized protein n=1 Tax=Struthio camelus TaxID=8801 RepID=UPI003603BEE7
MLPTSINRLTIRDCQFLRENSHVGRMDKKITSLCRHATENQCYPFQLSFFKGGKKKRRCHGRKEIQKRLFSTYLRFLNNTKLSREKLNMLFPLQLILYKGAHSHYGKFSIQDKQSCWGQEKGTLEKSEQMLCRRSRCNSIALCILKPKMIVAGIPISTWTHSWRWRKGYSVFSMQGPLGLRTMLACSEEVILKLNCSPPRRVWMSSTAMI